MHFFISKTEHPTYNKHKNKQIINHMRNETTDEPV